eukprot:4065771-Alexandrium_andersonii.AAC.1
MCLNLFKPYCALCVRVDGGCFRTGSLGNSRLDWLDHAFVAMLGALGDPRRLLGRSCTSTR